MNSSRIKLQSAHVVLELPLHDFSIDLSDAVLDSELNILHQQPIGCKLNFYFENIAQYNTFLALVNDVFKRYGNE